MKNLGMQDAADFVLSLAQQHQCSADVIVDSGEQLSLKSEAGALSEYKVTSSQTLGVRLIKDDRIATSFTEALDEESLRNLMAMTLESLPYMAQEPAEKIDGEPTYFEANPVLCPDDHTDEALKIDMALKLQGDIAERGAKAPYNGYSNSYSQRLYVNTQGSVCHEAGRRFSCYTSALIEKGDKNAMALHFQTSRYFADLNAEHVIATAYQKAENLLEGGPIATGKYDVIFEVGCLSELFSAFFMAFSGESARKGVNPWRNLVGQQVASNTLTLRDLPDVKGGMAQRYWDGEGNPTQALTLIEKGQLNTLLHNTKTARALNATANGSAARGPRGGLGVTHNHLVIDNGTQSLAEVNAGQWLEIVELQGLHSGADAISGDFSFGASGFLMQDNRIVQAVRGITVSGNFYQMLQQIVAVGDSQERSDDHCFFSPKVRFENLNIAG
uniref:TldD/PmbA family protein n=1 Tax=Thaumasiovibrio occultus TaxID=1891184 RepID=UPI000B357B9F|nr:metallopeptidase TldD-related protein [Thaumasiovibrio occultus]